MTAEKSTPSPSFSLYYAAFVTLLGALNTGFVFGYTMLALGNMRDPDKHNIYVEANSEESSWIASASVLGALLGSLLVGPITNTFGRKFALIVSNIPFVIGWLLIYFAPQIVYIYFGRFITGFAAGCMSGAIGIYLTEISTAKIRGFLGLGFGFTVAIGITVSTIIGELTGWRESALISAVPSIVMPLLMLFACETPVYLASKYGCTQRTIDALRKLRSQEDLTEELATIAEQAKIKMSFFLTWTQIRQANVYKPLLISLALFTCQQLSGITAIGFYQGEIVETSGFKCLINLFGRELDISNTIATLPALILSITGSLIIDKFGRKVLLYFSGVGIVTSLAILAGYFYQKNIDHQFEISFSWIALTAIMIFQGSNAIGFNTVPWLITPEITPNFARGFISTISITYNWCLAFLLSKTFPMLTTLLTAPGSFGLLCVCTVCSIIFVALCVPETKGKSYDEIQCIFNNRKPSRVSQIV